MVRGPKCCKVAAQSELWSLLERAILVLDSVSFTIMSRVREIDPEKEPVPTPAAKAGGEGDNGEAGPASSEQARYCCKHLL